MKDMRYVIPEIIVGNQTFDRAFGSFKQILQQTERDFRRKMFYETRNEKRRYKKRRRARNHKKKEKNRSLKRALNHWRRIY